MSKAKSKTKAGPTTEAQLLNLLKRVLPKATDDPNLASKIFDAVENELRQTARTTAFDKFCAKCALPNLEAESVQQIRQQLEETFGNADITVKPNKREEVLAVEVALPDGTQYASTIKVNADAAAAAAAEDDDGEPPAKFVPFPISLPGDPELIWFLAKREDVPQDEAAMALARAEENFWASKSGQNLIRKRVERSFPEFMARGAASFLTEVNLKRHYKTPEALKVLRQLPPPVKKAKE
jgi:hypothetical protein